MGCLSVVLIVLCFQSPRTCSGAQLKAFGRDACVRACGVHSRQPLSRRALHRGDHGPVGAAAPASRRNLRRSHRTPWHQAVGLVRTARRYRDRDPPREDDQALATPMEIQCDRGCQSGLARPGGGPWIRTAGLKVAGPRNKSGVTIVLSDSRFDLSPEAVAEVVRKGMGATVFAAIGICPWGFPQVREQNGTLGLRFIHLIVDDWNR